MITRHLGLYLMSGREASQAVQYALAVCICHCMRNVISVLTLLSGRLSWVSNHFLSRLTLRAIKHHYFSFDCAQMYHNESQTGTAIQKFLASSSDNTTGLKREDIHYTTKLASNGTYDAARKSIKQSVQVRNIVSLYWRSINQIV